MRPSILEPLLPVVHQILEDDRKAPKKQRHTAKRIFDRVRVSNRILLGLVAFPGDEVLSPGDSHEDVHR